MSCPPSPSLRPSGWCVRERVRVVFLCLCVCLELRLLRFGPERLPGPGAPPGAKPVLPRKVEKVEGLEARPAQAATQALSKHPPLVAPRHGGRQSPEPRLGFR